MDTSKLSKLATEYRPTMDTEVLHAWAQDVRKAVGPAIGDVYTVAPDSLSPLAGQTVTVMQNRWTYHLGTTRKDCFRPGTPAAFDARGRFVAMGVNYCITCEREREMRVENGEQYCSVGHRQ